MQFLLGVWGLGGEDAGSFTDLLTSAIKLPGQSVYLTWVSLM